MIYLWRIPNEYPESLIGEYDKECSPDRFLFVQGKQIGNGSAVPSFRFTGNPEALRKYDVLPNSTMIPLVSERVAQILTRVCRNDIELLTASVHAAGEKLSGFCLVNVLPRVASVDHGGSNFIFIPGTKQIMKFNRLKLKSDALGAHHLAREVEFNSFILVSEILKQVFDSERVTGHAFAPPEAIKP
jgi:hypothetical protein